MCVTGAGPTSVFHVNKDSAFSVRTQPGNWEPQPCSPRLPGPTTGGGELLGKAHTSKGKGKWGTQLGGPAGRTYCWIEYGGERGRGLINDAKIYRG